MVSIPALWLPILVSAVLVFVVSSVVHMFLGYHWSDFKKLPNEDRTLDALRAENIAPGEYFFPRPPSHREMGSADMIEKCKRGPVGILTLLPSGPPSMAKNLVQWFVYCVAVGVAVAYLTGRALGPGATYLSVFRFAGTSAFYAHALGGVVESIWKGRAWSTTAKNVFDGLLYALVTAGAFGWLWP
jgi:hypothetical protein